MWVVDGVVSQQIVVKRHGFRFSDFGFKVLVFRSRVSGFGLRFPGFVFQVGFRVPGFGVSG